MKYKKMELIIEKGVKNQERLKTKLAKFNIERKVNEKKLAELIPQGASSSAAESSSGAGRFKLKARAKAKPKAKSRATEKDIVYVQQPMTQPMPQYRQQPVYAPVPQPQTQPPPQPQPQPVATGSGKHRRQKAVSRLKPIQEEEEEIRTVIKPARNHLPHLDMMNDVFLVNKLH